MGIGVSNLAGRYDSPLMSPLQICKSFDLLQEFQEIARYLISAEQLWSLKCKQNLSGVFRGIKSDHGT